MKVIIKGQRASGKTTVGAVIAQALRAHGYEVVFRAPTRSIAALHEGVSRQLDTSELSGDGSVVEMYELNE